MMVDDPSCYILNFEVCPSWQTAVEYLEKVILRLALDAWVELVRVSLMRLVRKRIQYP
jgi:hypothetical protein